MQRSLVIDAFEMAWQPRRPPKGESEIKKMLLVAQHHPLLLDRFDSVYPPSANTQIRTLLAMQHVRGRPLKQLEAEGRPKDACAGQHDVSGRNSLDAKMSVKQLQNKIRAFPEPRSSDRCDLSHQNSRVLG